MEPAVLQTLLMAGPMRKFDVLGMTRRALTEGREHRDLFRLGFLNRSIIFKIGETAEFKTSLRAEQAWKRPIGTLVYLPYQADRPGHGGETFVCEGLALERICESKGLCSMATDDLAHDETILMMLANIPALSPFLIKEQFERCGNPLPASYLALSAKTAERLRQRLTDRVRPLILAAFNGDGTQLGEALNRLADAFIRPDESAATDTIASALRLDRGDAAEILGAWTGIAYFEDEVRRLHPHIRDLAVWFSKFGRPRETLTREESLEVDRLANAAKSNIRNGWRQIRDLLNEYQQTYEALIFYGNPKPFVAFLRGCRLSYWHLGDLVGRFEQTVLAWRSYTRSHPDEALPMQQFSEFVRFVNETHKKRHRGQPGGSLSHRTSNAA